MVQGDLLLDRIESGDVADVEALLAGLASDDDVEVVATALLLAEIGNGAASAVPALTERLERADSREVQWACAYALGRIGGPARAAVPALMRATARLDRDVRDEASTALDRIMAEPHELVTQ